MRLLSRVEHPHDFDLQFDGFPVENLDLIWPEVPKPKDFAWPDTYLNAQRNGDFDRIRALYSAAIETVVPVLPIYTGFLIGAAGLGWATARSVDSTSRRPGRWCSAARPATHWRSCPSRSPCPRRSPSPPRSSWPGPSSSSSA